MNNGENNMIDLNQLKDEAIDRLCKTIKETFAIFGIKDKSTLTEDERVILSNIITNNYKYIHRDGSGSLWITEDVWLKPKKDPMLNIPCRAEKNTR